LKNDVSQGEDRMNSKSQKETAASLLKVIPAKWAVAIIAALIVYVLLQPRLNQWFGWNLPSVASLTGDEPAKTQPKKKADAKPSSASKSNKSQAATDYPELESTAPEQKKPEQKKPEQKSPDKPKASSDPNNPPPSKSKASSNGTESSKTSGSATKSKSPSQSVEDYLKEVGKNRFESPAGLIYKPGSEEGHRLKHIERHLKDIPDRPGSHGVFDGSMVEFLIAIDDAVTRAKRKLKGTSMEEDDGAMVYEAAFDKPIGFLGGETGKRKKNPKVKKMRVVIQDDAVITAFPF
jgi:hypothetical protein